MLKTIIEQLMQRNDLDKNEISSFLDHLLKSDNQSQIAASLSLFHSKGESAEEMSALINIMREQAESFKVQGLICDIVGTGGDGKNSLNISTASAILASALGVKIIKNGNRAVTSRCGSADVLEYLGVNINGCTKSLQQQFAQTGFAFCLATNFYKNFSRLKKIRKELAVPTVFNLIGPLLNPAQPEIVLFGVADLKRLAILAQTLAKQPLKSALVFHSAGFDELISFSPAQGFRVFNQEVSLFYFDPKEHGFLPGSAEDLRGGTVADNALAIERAFNGEPSVYADTVALNAAMALTLFDEKYSLSTAIRLAQTALQEGSGARQLNKIIAASHLEVAA